MSQKLTSSIKMLIGLTLLAVNITTRADELAAPAGFDREKLEAITALVDNLYEDGLIPNYVVDIQRRGETIYHAERGRTTLGTGSPVNSDTIYAIASMTKPIVSTAILRLIQEGRIQLDDPLMKFLPEFESMLVAPGGSLSSTFEEASGPITIRHLLTHTSGFTYPPAVLGVGDVAEQYAEIGLVGNGATSIQEFTELLAQLPLVAHPGETFNYSVSVDVLGAIIEKITGQRMGDYLDEIIFKPLGMKDTAFEVASDDRVRFARIYAPSTPNNPAPFFEADPIKWQISETLYFDRNFEQMGVRGDWDSGGGGLYSTVRDYQTYAAMVANRGELNGVRILNEDIADIHFQDLMPGLGLEAFQAAFGDAASSMKFAGGYGIRMKDDGSGDPDYYFWGGAANTFFWIDADDGSTGTFFTHVAPIRYNLIDQIEQIVDEARL